MFKFIFGQKRQFLSTTVGVIIYKKIKLKKIGGKMHSLTTLMASNLLPDGYIKNILFIIAGMGALLISFKILSEGIEKLANSRLKSIFRKTSNNKFIGVGIGLGTTAIIQSSTATTVMVVGFTNAGLMTLLQATCIIMGANIGTTVTGLLAALASSSFDVTLYAMLLTTLGMFISMFAKKDKLKTIGYTIAGLGLVFFSLKIMSANINELNEFGVINNFLAKINNPFLLLFVGFIITALVHSSSLVTSIIITMVAGGVAFGGGSNGVLYIILGTNIGTTVTAMMSSIGTTTNAKRAGLIHLMFNFFGSIIWFIVLLIWKDFMDVTFVRWFPGQPNFQIALFHTFFNTVCTIIFLPFAEVLFVKLSKLLIREKPDKSQELSFMDERFINSAPVALQQLSKEFIRMATLAMDNLKVAFSGFIAKDDSKADELRDNADKISHINKQIISYLVKVSANNVSYEDEKFISTLHHVVGDALRVSELSCNVVKYTQRTIEQELEFSDQVKVQLQEMFDKINMVFESVVEVFANKDVARLPEIDKMEDEIDAMRKNLVDSHIKRLNKGECQPQNSGVFINLVNNLERVADHLTYIAHSVA